MDKGGGCNLFPGLRNDESHAGQVPVTLDPRAGIGGAVPTGGDRPPHPATARGAASTSDPANDDCELDELDKPPAGEAGFVWGRHLSDFSSKMVREHRGQGSGTKWSPPPFSSAVANANFELVHFQPHMVSSGWAAFLQCSRVPLRRDATRGATSADGVPGGADVRTSSNETTRSTRAPGGAAGS